MKKVIFIVLIFGVYGCVAEQQIEESIKIHNEKSHQLFVNRLKKEGIPFYIKYDNQIFYPVEHRKIVNEISDSILGTPGAEKKGIKVKSEQGILIRDYLNTNGVLAEFILPDNTTVILWPIKQNAKAEKLVKEVMSKNGWDQVSKTPINQFSPDRITGQTIETH